MTAPLATREALALGHKLRLLARVVAYPDGTDLSVPCPHPGCRVMLHVHPADDGWPLTMAIVGHRHPWMLAHRECVEIVVSEYLAWYRDRAREELPF